MNTEELKTALKNGVVVFEYTKKDGTKRIARGTLNENLLPETEPDEFELDKTGVDSLVESKYGSFEEYLENNKIEHIGESEDGTKYLFRHKKKERKKNENIVSYYDLDKDEFRSFNKENFIGVISTE